MSEPALQKHGDPSWPECWLFYIRTAPEGTTCGELVKLDRGVLTYACTCGQSHTRGEPGFENEATSAWVARHRHHLPEELR